MPSLLVHSACFLVERPSQSAPVKAEAMLWLTLAACCTLYQLRGMRSMGLWRAFIPHRFLNDRCEWYASRSRERAHAALCSADGPLSGSWHVATLTSHRTTMHRAWFAYHRVRTSILQHICPAGCSGRCKRRDATLVAGASPCRSAQHAWHREVVVAASGAHFVSTVSFDEARCCKRQAGSADYCCKSLCPHVQTWSRAYPLACTCMCTRCACRKHLRCGVTGYNCRGRSQKVSATLL